MEGSIVTVKRRVKFKRLHLSIIHFFLNYRTIIMARAGEQQIRKEYEKQLKAKDKEFN